MSTILAREDAAVYGKAPRIKKRMSEEEFVEWYSKTDETVHAEWIDGEVVMMSPNNIQHQRIEFSIAKLIDRFVRRKGLGEVFLGGIAMRLASQRSRREPDIFFIAKKSAAAIQKNHIEGPPDLALEIVSPESVERDYRIKYYEYEAAGIREYWIVNPLAPSISAYALNAKGRYEQIEEKSGKIASKILPGFYLRVEWIVNPAGFDEDEVLKEMGVK